jgi:membrane-bound metal-dependent hydrolase YbcI (DUF457 family)
MSVGGIMAGFRMHITVSSLCGVAAAVASVKLLGHPIESAFLVGSVTAVGGMLPDLDSDSGVPVREMSGLAASVIPLLLYNRLSYSGLTHEGILALLVGAYLLIRYGAFFLFNHLTVHRGMFHSIPAMLIAGLSVYLAYDTRTSQQSTRYILGAGVMIGFLSHLILDEIYSVDFNGIRLKLKSSAGSALKFFSTSVFGTTSCYALLGALGFLAYIDYQHHQRGNHDHAPVVVELTR